MFVWLIRLYNQNWNFQEFFSGCPWHKWKIHWDIVVVFRVFSLFSSCLCFFLFLLSVCKWICVRLNAYWKLNVYSVLPWFQPDFLPGVRINMLFGDWLTFVSFTAHIWATEYLANAQILWPLCVKYGTVYSVHSNWFDGWFFGGAFRTCAFHIKTNKRRPPSVC